MDLLRADGQPTGVNGHLRCSYRSKVMRLTEVRDLKVVRSRDRGGGGGGWEREREGRGQEPIKGGFHGGRFWGWGGGGERGEEIT